MSDIADTTYGPIQGKVREDVLLFAGIPYAAAPIGSLRFKEAQPHAGWSQVRQTTRFSPAAPQVVTGGMTNSAPVNWNEDCLYLNVTTPSLDDKKRPVFFWIHGGGYRTGQGGIPWYNGAKFARDSDIVVVSINYRMGMLGFTDLTRFGEGYETSGINGILDQIKALEWVRDNIANFGGDPEQVTIAGESAGGFSVGTLLGSPRAQGLFTRAIPQSGAAHHTLPKPSAEKVTDILIKQSGLDSVEAFQNLSAQDVLSLQVEIDKQVARGADGLGIGSIVTPFYPAEGNEALPQSPLTAIENGLSRDVDVLIGTNKDEGTLFVTGKSDQTKLEAAAEGYGNKDGLLRAYKSAYPDATTTDLTTYLSTDHVFRIPCLRLAEARMQNGSSSNTWMYLFAWESRVPGLRSTHALEIPFMFNNLDRAGVVAFIGEGDMPQNVADTMHRAWVEFIKTGNPGWAPYDLDQRLNMVFDTESKLIADPDKGRREAWQGIR